MIVLTDFHREINADEGFLHVTEPLKWYQPYKQSLSIQLVPKLTHTLVNSYYFGQLVPDL